jgi:hypothetical protein
MNKSNQECLSSKLNQVKEILICLENNPSFTARKKTDSAFAESVFLVKRRKSHDI